LDPNYEQAQSRLSTAYLDTRRYDKAIALRAAIARATNQSLGGVLGVEQARMLAGRPNDFERLLDDAVTRLREHYLSPGALAN
jgi:hypothetical protein